VGPGLLVVAVALGWCGAALAGGPKLPTGEPATPQGPNPFLAQAKELYQKLEFEKCLQRLGQAPQWRSSPTELLEIELFAGMCSYNLNQLPQAEERFRLALRISPAAELPPYTSPKLMDFFRRIKKSMPKPPPQKEERPEKNEKAEKPDRPEKSPPPEKAEPPKVAAVEAAPEVLESPPVDAPKADLPRAEPKPELGRDPALEPVPEKPAGRAPEVTAEPTFLQRHAGPLALGGVAVVAVAVGVGLGANAKSLEAKANAAQYDSDFHSFANAARANSTGANVSYGLAAAALVGAVVWLLLDLR